MTNIPQAVLVWLGLRNGDAGGSQQTGGVQEASPTRIGFTVIGIVVASLRVSGLIGGVMAMAARAEQRPGNTAQHLLNADALQKFSVDFRGGVVVILES